MSPAEAAYDLGRMIIAVRETKVILDSNLALLYGVSTTVFNQAVKRNRERFPESFMFQLERQEFTLLISQTVTSKGRGGRRKLPYVFNSPKAVKMSVALIEAFVRLRQEFTTMQALARRLAEIEKTVMTHDQALVKLFAVIKPLLSPPPEPPRKKIGFHP